MRFNRVSDIQTARNVLSALKPVPEKLLYITDCFGISIYCFNKTFCPSWIGLIDKGACFNDGRSMDETSYYSPNHKGIFIFDNCLVDIGEKAFSTVLHEYGHALDHALGCRTGKNNYLSGLNPDIKKRWSKGKGLDWYANTNPQEYFSQAFMAYFYEGIETYKPWSYREHTQQELKQRDSEMLYYLKAIIKGMMFNV